MMKYLKKLLPLTILVLFLISMIMFADNVIESVSFAIDICINNLFPSLLPFLILSAILCNYGFVEVIGHILRPIMINIFHLNSNLAYVLVLSMLSGSPANSKYIKQLLDNHKITINDANQILKFSHFVNPIFVVGTIGTIFLGNKTYGFLILISHYLANFLIGIFTRPKEKPNIKKTNIFNIETHNFVSTLTHAIKDTIDTLLLIFGTITCCLVFSSIINTYFNFNPIFNGILEITSGLKYTSISNISVSLKIIISAFFISFGGISIHMQVLSILDNKKIRYLPYLEARILQGILTSIIAALLYITIFKFSVLN